MAWTILYTVTTEGVMSINTTSYHDAEKAHEDVQRKLKSMYGLDADFKIICMIKGSHDVWYPETGSYV